MRILVFQHLAVEHPGVFRDFWAEAGYLWDAVELDSGEVIPALEPYDLLVVMGGPMDVWQVDEYPWLAPEIAAIRRWVVELRRPYLGICFGHQLLAVALGGKVGLMARPEVGMAKVALTQAGLADPLLAGFAPEVEVFQWHGAEVSGLPEGARILAQNDACPAQAIKWGEHAYGFQYHIEITPATVAEWGAVPEYRASLELALGDDMAARLEGIVAAKLPAFRAAAARLNGHLFALIEGV
ncbi:MAG: GMP synthase [Acidocella sp. 20-63-7]|nr:MAG: GMP synthase [Acidocella sp. 20-63-7]HQT46076.1 type 1 glutamine amidotransferase [Acidocella sp.]